MSPLCLSRTLAERASVYLATSKSPRVGVLWSRRAAGRHACGFVG